MIKNSYNQNRILNKVVRSALENKVADMYKLNTEGQRLVLESNSSLTLEYVEAHMHTVTKYWYEHIKNILLVVPPKSYNTVVDICCGSGFITTHIMTNQLFAHCYAIDINSNQLLELKKILSSENIGNVHLIKGDVQGLPFTDNSVDAVMGNSFLHHIPDNSILLREIYRVLKPGGVFCCTHEPSVSAGYLEDFPLGNIIRLLEIFHVKNLIKRLLRRPLNAEARRQIILSDIWLYNEENIMMLLRRAGFNEIVVTSRGFISTIVLNMVRSYWHLIHKQNIPANLSVNLLRVFDGADRILLKPFFPNDYFSSLQFNARKTSQR